MGCGWGGTVRKPRGRPRKRQPPALLKSLLIVLFEAFGWRIVFALARPVTPEVAGSSPVAPVKYLQIAMFCCRSRRKRPSASFHPAHIPPETSPGNPRSKPLVPDDPRNLNDRPNQPEVFRRANTEELICRHFARADTGP
jgi:hypothetical protein